MVDDQRKTTATNVNPAMRETPRPDGSSGEDKQLVAEDQLGDVADAAHRNMPGLPSNLAVDPTLGANKPRRFRWLSR